MYKPKFTKLQFNKLPKNQQRIELAKDVLVRIEINNLKPIEGSYILFGFPARIKNKLIKNVINEGSCEVCSRGALFCSYLGIIGGRKKLSDFESFREGEITEIYFNSRHKEEELTLELFTEQELAIMEIILEGEPSGSLSRSQLNTKYKNKALALYDLFTDHFSEEQIPTEVITFIMKNIIRNGGSFNIFDDKEII